jgi:general secretion pathway protein F
MPQFRYRAIGPGGESAIGVLEAPDRQAVLDQLRAMGMLPVETVESAGGGTVRPPWWKREIRLGGTLSGRGASAKGLGYAVQELAVLLDAGLPLDRSLAIIAGQREHRGLRPALVEVLDRVRGGAPLAEAMRDHPAVFPPVAIALVEAGEASGALNATLGRLAEMLLRAEQLREQLRSALIYPILLLFAAGGSVLLLLTVVVPQFEAFFEGSRVALPTATVVVLAASRLLREDGVLLLLALLAALAGLRILLRRPGVRQRMERALLRAPLAGPLVSRIETARFARTLGTLVESGVALAGALPIARRTFANSAIAEAVDAATQSLKEGEGLAGPLEATGLLPPIAITFLRTGEETGRLGEMLTRLADALDRDIQKTTARFLSLLVPVITILLGILVATVVGAILTAMLSINELAN